jgi:predicted ATP-dependent Lon-type protease
MVSTETYVAVKDTDQAYAAYNTLRESQKDYYATDDGIEEIETVLKNPQLSEAKHKQIKAIYDEAIKARALYEEELDINTFFVPTPPKQYEELPAGKGNVNDVHNLSCFNDENGEVMLNWDVNTQLITLASNGRTNVEEIGMAGSSDEAVRKATEWYNNNVAFSVKS